MSADLDIVPPPDDGPKTEQTGPLRPDPDPWGLMLIGATEGIGPLCAEAGRLGFELFKAPSLSEIDVERLHESDWVAALVVEDGTELATTVSVLDGHLNPAVPVVWIGGAPSFQRPRPVVRLPAQSPAELIAAEVFGQARGHLYPADLIPELQRCARHVLADWGEPQVDLGPVWVKNHFTPPFSMTAALDLYGDVSGELAVSASAEWFESKRGARAVNPEAADAALADRTARDEAADVARALLEMVVEYLESRGADLSMGPSSVFDGGQPVNRRMSHRPALCLEMTMNDGELFVVEFSGTGLDILEPAAPGAALTAVESARPVAIDPTDSTLDLSIFTRDVA